MPRLENNGGDVLARGGVRATFKPMGGNISQEKWDAMWETEDAKDSGDAGVPPAVDAGTDAGEIKPSVFLAPDEPWF